MTVMTSDPTDTSSSDAVIARLHSLHPKVIDLSLDRMHDILAKLGHPEKALPPVIHVAGTNGKGSTVATLRAIAEASGLRVHVYTSPHLVHFHERIRLAGHVISESYLTNILSEVEAATDNAPITFFEVTTAAALLAFSRVPADLLILEVGLGGRLDATNVIDAPCASIITPIGLDHEQFLGSDISGIAREKAGIMKSGCPVIIGPQIKPVTKTLLDQAAEKKAKAYRYGQEWKVTIPAKGKTFTYEDKHGSLTLPHPALAGRHQIANAAQAIAALRHQSAIKIAPSAFRAGMNWIKWPARLQPLSAGDITRLARGETMPSGTRIYLDGGHNPHAAETIRQFLKQFDPVEEPIWLVLGMMARKDITGFLEPFSGLGARVIALPIDGHDGSAMAADIASSATDIGMNGRMASDAAAALKLIKQDSNSGERPVILLGGSLYLAGNILKSIGWKAK